MIIGFGFGSPFTAFLMLIITGFISYFLVKFIRSLNRKSFYLEDKEVTKEKRREYYYDQRRKAKELMDKYDLTNEEIERIIEEELKE
jgi:Mor family transcriptional regulator